MPANHPAARAEARCHPQDDATLSAQVSAVELDLRLAQLSTLTEPTDAARAEIQACRLELDRIAGHAESGSDGAYWSWFRQSVSVIRTAALRLFPTEPWTVDVTRGPAWTP